MTSTRTILTSARRPVVVLMAVAALTALLSLCAPPAQAALEGPDTMPFKGSFPLWCSWNNPSVFNNCTNYHSYPALDIGLPRNTAIYAAGPGSVVGAANGCAEGNLTCQGGQGNYVAILHPNGIYSRYLHLTSSVVAVSQGVSRGQLIGYSGASGSVCQPVANCAHLHYDEVDNIVTTHTIDPGPMLAYQGGVQVSVPQSLGYASWNLVPYATMLTNEGLALPPAPAASFHSVVPFRALDSRTPTGGWSTQLGAHQSRDLHVTGGLVPDSASAVVMNVTTTNATAPSFLTVYPSGDSTPTASNLNFGGATVANLVVSRVGVGGNASFYNENGSVDVVADIVGYLDDGTVAGDHFVGLSPTRTLDSRSGAGGWMTPLQAGETRSMAVRNVGGVPGNASTVVMNVTVTQGTANSFVSGFPSAAALPISSNLNFAAGQTISNLVVTQMGADGNVSLFNSAGSVDVIVDVVGYFDPYAPGGLFHAMTSVRVLDDRNGTGGYSTPWAEGQSRTVTVAGVAGVPAGATAVIINLTSTNGQVGSFLTAFAAGSPLPGASNLLFGPGETVPNLVMVPVGANGAIEIYNQLGSVDVIADVVGYYATT